MGVSVDGTGELHDQYCHRKGGHAAVMRNAARRLNRGKVKGTNRKSKEISTTIGKYCTVEIVLSISVAIMIVCLDWNEQRRR